MTKRAVLRGVLIVFSLDVASPASRCKTPSSTPGPSGRPARSMMSSSSYRLQAIRWRRERRTRALDRIARPQLRHEPRAVVASDAMEKSSKTRPERAAATKRPRPLLG